MSLAMTLALDHRDVFVADHPLKVYSNTVGTISRNWLIRAA